MSRKSSKNIESVLRRLKSFKSDRKGNFISANDVKLLESDIDDLCVASKELFRAEPMLLEIDAPVTIVGDIHGQYTDLLRIFLKHGFPPKTKYLFLGDYVDKGPQSIETISLLLAYKIKHPQHFFLLRGNHECTSTNKHYGFFEECKRNYNVNVWKLFNDCFKYIPAAAIVGGKLFCCHGGLSDELNSMDNIRQIERPISVLDNKLLCDLLWSDPHDDIENWSVNVERGAGKYFGEKQVTEFLQKHNFTVIVRAHQFIPEGHRFFGSNKGLVTVFSAPNYLNEKNNGSVMIVQDNLEYTFDILTPHSPQ